MAKVNPQEFAAKWSGRLNSATEDIRRGVSRVTTAPTELAAQKKDKMRAKVVEAIDSGKWEQGLRRVSLSDWQAAMTDVGIGRIAAGTQAAIPKVEAFASELLPHIESGQSRVAGMPDVTLEDSINRMTTFVRHMSEFRRIR